MSIFAISDLHLSLGCDKPMDIFGEKWVNYTDRMRRNWNSIVTDKDYVIIPGDISWATYIEDAEEDFKYIDKLNGKKILLKGNHDYWWTTSSKMKKFFESRGFDTIGFIQNNAYIADCCDKKVAICGTRGWITPPPGSDGENRKIYEREKQRLLLSVQEAARTGADEIICAMHYPPTDNISKANIGLANAIRGNSNATKENISDTENLINENGPFIEIMRQFGINLCVYGHLHAASHMSAPKGVYGGVNLKLVSCDYLNFIPLLILK